MNVVICVLCAVVDHVLSELVFLLQIVKSFLVDL